MKRNILLTLLIAVTQNWTETTGTAKVQFWLMAQGTQSIMADTAARA